jgi:hypothetical protein
MRKVERRISQSAMARLRKTMQRAEMQGYGPTDCVRFGLTAIGLRAEDFTETVLIVDPTLDGPVYPFMDWPAELAAGR